MPNPDRLFDKTHLSIDQAEARGFIHRDYIAHCFRWSHVVKFLMQRHRYSEEIILDVGCGRDLPLPRLMYSNKMTDFAYVGIDMNDLEMPEMLKTAVANGKADIQLMPRTDASLITESQLEFNAPTVGVCFEVLEHVHPKICRRLVKNIHSLLAPGADCFFSTPVYNGSAAANHIHEMKRTTVGALMEDVGFYVVDHWGTFASQSEIEPHIRSVPARSDAYDRLAGFYDSNILATIFAPMFPHASRNCMWHVRKMKGVGKMEKEFPEGDRMPRPLSQHPDAEELFHEAE